MNEPKTLYFDCSQGLNANVVVGALCSLGVPPSALEWELGQVALGEYHLHFDRQTVDGQEAVSFWFHPGAHHHEPSEHVHDGEAKAHEHSHASGHDHGVQDSCAQGGDEHDHDHEHEHGHDHGCCDHGHGHDHDDDHRHDHDHHEGCCGHEHDEPEGMRIGDAREMVEAAELAAGVKQRVSAILGRLAGSVDRVALAELAALIGACAGIEHLAVARVAFFARSAAKEDALGAALAAEFVTSSCAMPAIRQERMGVGVDRAGCTIRAVLGCEE